MIFLNIEKSVADVIRLQFKIVDHGLQVHIDSLINRCKLFGCQVEMFLVFFHLNIDIHFDGVESLNHVLFEMRVLEL